MFDRVLKGQLIDYVEGILIRPKLFSFSICPKKIFKDLMFYSLHEKRDLLVKVL